MRVRSAAAWALHRHIVITRYVYRGRQHSLLTKKGHRVTELDVHWPGLCLHHQRNPGPFSPSTTTQHGTDSQSGEPTKYKFALMYVGYVCVHTYTHMYIYIYVYINIYAISDVEHVCNGIFPSSPHRVVVVQGRLLFSRTQAPSRLRSPSKTDVMILTHSFFDTGNV